MAWGTKGTGKLPEPTVTLAKELLRTGTGRFQVSKGRRAIRPGQGCPPGSPGLYLAPVLGDGAQVGAELVALRLQQRDSLAEHVGLLQRLQLLLAQRPQLLGGLALDGVQGQLGDLQCKHRGGEFNTHLELFLKEFFLG